MDNMASYRPPVAAAALAVLSAAGVFACTRALGREQIDHAAAVEPEPEPEPEPAAANAGKKNDDDADELAEEARLAKKRAEIDAKPRPQTGMERVKAKVGEAKWAAMSAKQRKMAMLKELARSCLQCLPQQQSSVQGTSWRWSHVLETSSLQQQPS